MEQSFFPFLRLPRELRDKIYRSILVHDEGVVIQILCPHYNIDPRHDDTSTCDYQPYHHFSKSYKLPRVADLEILRSNKQIHAEARDIFLEGNTFAFPWKNPPGKILREETMKEVSSIKAAFESPNYRDHYYIPAPKCRKLRDFIHFLTSRPPLKRLQLTFWGAGWKLAAFKRLLNRVRVRERVLIVNNILDAWDLREGPCKLIKSQLTEEDRKFCKFVKDLEKSMLTSDAASTAHPAASGSSGLHS